MVKFFSQSHKYDDPWQIVTLAYFLRYPNPYASHVLACDVISRLVTDEGTLKTTRLIKKTGALPSWFPKQFVSRSEAWVVEESEVDPEGRVVRSTTRNLDHVKVMRVQEDVVLKELEDGMTLQKTTASFISNFGWGLTKKIEKYGATKFKANLERSRQGISLVLSAMRESRTRLGLQPFLLGGGDPTGLDASMYASVQREYWTTSRPDRIPDAADLGSAYHANAVSSIGPHDDDGPDFSSSTPTPPSPAVKRSWLPRWVSNRFSYAGTTPSPPSRDAAGRASPDV